ncbi:MAG TPA: MlaD family protein [Longimicrobium sp.]|nr:MlaD family protein [Longimicrobium sp.]
MIQRADGGAPAAPRSRISQQELSLVTPTRSPRREVQVGIFVLAGVLAVLVALFVLTDPGLFRGRYYVTTQVTDAGGIRKRDPVQLNGVNIGRVDDLRLIPGGVQLRLELQGEYPVPADSRVRLAAQGLLGEKVAQILPGRSPERVARGGTLLSTDAEGGLGNTAQELGDQAQVLGTKADTVLTRAQLLLSQQTIGAVGASAQELQTTLAQLALLASEQRRELSALTGSLQRSAQGLEGATTRPELARAIARTDSLTIKLDAATTSLNTASTALANVVGRMDRGEGTLGKLSRDDALYNNLNTAVTNLATLTEEIRANPKKYLSVSVF